MLHHVGQRPPGAGRHGQVEAGRGGDCDAEGRCTFVDQPQQFGKLQSLVLSGGSIILIQLPDSGLPSRYGGEIRKRAYARVSATPQQSPAAPGDRSTIHSIAPAASASVKIAVDSRLQVPSNSHARKRQYAVCR